MVNQVIKYNIKYLENCNYEASELKGECQIPQQNVDINISIENSSAIKRVGYNSVTQHDYQTNNKIYYNDVLRVTVSLSIANVPSSIVNIGSLSISYLDKNMQPESLCGSDIPVSKSGQVIFTFKPHYTGYIKIVYNDSSNFFLTTEKQSDLIVLDKIPIDTYTVSNPMFLEHEKETELICDVVDVYGNKLDYGHVVFLGYHDIPRDSENPMAGQEVVLGNPVPVIDGTAKLKYVPEQDISVEYIVGHYNYYNELYGNNFKYYEAHGSHTHVSTLQRGTLNFALGVLQDNNIVDTTIFDGFIHLEQGETIRASARLLDEDSNEVTIKNDMKLTLHIEGTKHIINQSYNNAKARNVEAWMKENVIFEEYEDAIDLGTNKTIDVNNIPSGYYNIYMTFKDTDDKTDENRVYYEDYTSDIMYVAINQPNIIINPILSYINPVSNENNTYTAQVNDNLSANLKAACSNVPSGMRGKFTINNVDYQATYQNGYFIPNQNIKINKIGDYYIHFSTYAAYYENQGYYPIQSATPILLKVRDILEPIIEIPQGYVDNEYPGQIKYILSVKNWYDETGINITVNVKNVTTNSIIQTYTEEYKGIKLTREISNLPPGKYQIEATINNKKATSTQHTINKANIIGEIDELSGQNITSGIPKNIQFNIQANKSVLSNSIINGAKIYAKKGNLIIPFNIQSENVTVYNDNKILSIYYPILLYLDGDWSIRFTQANNSTYNSGIFVPNDSNLNSFTTEAKTFTVDRTQANIKINKDINNLIINITNNNATNNQILLFNLKITYGSFQTVEIPVLTQRDNSIEIPLSEIHEDFESTSIRQQIFNVKVTLDPYNNELMDTINGKNINEIKTAIIDAYDNLYNTSVLDDFATQIKEEMRYTALFATYNKTVKSESYGD